MAHPAVLAMLTDDQAPTCSLAEFVDAWNEEADLVWRLRTGHLIHLLAAAVARIEALETLLDRREALGVVPGAVDRHAAPFDRVTEAPAEPELFQRGGEHSRVLGWFRRGRQKPTRSR